MRICFKVESEMGFFFKTNGFFFNIHLFCICIMHIDIDMSLVIITHPIIKYKYTKGIFKNNSFLQRTD